MEKSGLDDPNVISTGTEIMEFSSFTREVLKSQSQSFTREVQRVKSQKTKYLTMKYNSDNYFNITTCIHYMYKKYVAHFIIPYH